MIIFTIVSFQLFRDLIGPRSLLMRALLPSSLIDTRCFGSSRTILLTCISPVHLPLTFSLHLLTCSLLLRAYVLPHCTLFVARKCQARCPLAIISSSAQPPLQASVQDSHLRPSPSGQAPPQALAPHAGLAWIRHNYRCLAPQRIIGTAQAATQNLQDSILVARPPLKNHGAQPFWHFVAQVLGNFGARPLQ